MDEAWQKKLDGARRPGLDGTTHYEGCENHHLECCKAALLQARLENVALEGRLQEANGAMTRLSPVSRQCPACHGKGGTVDRIDEYGGPAEHCGYCDGKGEILDEHQYFVALGHLSAEKRAARWGKEAKHGA